MIQGGAIDYNSHLPVPVTIISGESKYIAAAVACMKASHLRMMGYDIEKMGDDDYGPMNIKYPPVKIIIDIEAAKAMSECNKDIKGNRNVTRIYHYVRQECLLREHKFAWIGTNFQSKFKDIIDKFIVDLEDNTND